MYIPTNPVNLDRISVINISNLLLEKSGLMTRYTILFVFGYQVESKY